MSGNEINSLSNFDKRNQYLIEMSVPKNKLQETVKSNINKANMVTKS